MCGISATSKPVSSTPATVSETPSTVIEPFSTQIAQQLGRRLDPDADAVALRLDRDDTADTVDVTLHLVAAERIAGAERRLDVDVTGRTASRARASRHDVEREPSAAVLDHGQADAVDRDRVADLAGGAASTTSLPPSNDTTSPTSRTSP